MAKRRKKKRTRRLEPGHPQPPGSMPGRSRITWLALLAALAIGALLYGGTLRFPFAYDDESYLLNNPLLKHGGSFLSVFDFQKIRSLIRDHQLNWDVGTNFVLRPFTYFTFFLNYVAAGGWSEAACRAVNIIIHCLNGFLVFQLLSDLLRLSPKGRSLRPSSMVFIPAAAALLFLVHPLQVEAVTFITQRFTSLGTLFYLLALLLYFRSNADHEVTRPRLWRAASVVALILGMLSKEEVFTAPLMAVFLDHVIFETPWKKSLRRAAPLLACMAIIPSVIIALAVSDHSRKGLLEHSVFIASSGSWDYDFSYALTQVRVVALYLSLLLFPKRLNVDWDVSPSQSLLDARVLGCGIFLVSVLGTAWICHATRPREARHALLYGGMAWYFVTLAVSSSIIPLPDFMAEHRAYLGSIGVIAALACVADFLRTGLFRNRRIALAVPVAVGMLCLGFGVATAVRNQVWRSGISLWTDAALKSPGKYRTWGNLGACYGVKGDLERARKCLEKAISLSPEYTVGYQNLANILSKQKKYDQSVRVSMEGFRHCGNNVSMHYNVAVALAGAGRLNEAVAALQETVALNPHHFLAHLGLGKIYAKQTKYDAAMREYKIAGKLAPEDPRPSRGMEKIQTNLHPLAGNGSL